VACSQPLVQFHAPRALPDDGIRSGRTMLLRMYRVPTRMLNAERGMYIRHSLETDRILWQHGLSMRIVLDIAAQQLTHTMCMVGP
jgi:hypothetical protein